MPATDRALALKSGLEARLLRLSIAATVLVAALGVLLGILSNSLAILFDGFFSLIDAVITWLMLVVARLVAREADARFQYGYWHLEPLVVALKASVLLLLVAVGFFGAIQSILAGGHTPELGLALVYAAVVAAVCIATWFWLTRQNARIGSALVAIDARSWLMSGIITTALLLAFATARALEGTNLAHLIPYVDPTVLALLSLLILPLPWRDARTAFNDILGLSPADLDRHVAVVMDDFVARHGFAGHAHYVTRTGRAKFIEIAVLAPPGMPPRPIEAFDAFRAEIGSAIGDAGPDRWLTITFTADAGQL